jgi:hypothetical protein
VAHALSRCVRRRPTLTPSRATQAYCTAFLECSAPYFTAGPLYPYSTPSPPPYPGLLRVFGAADLWVDCAGTPLGPAVLDFCNVCGGDNSTCSGCDGVPNSIVDGLRLDKQCSGHGSCRSAGPISCSLCLLRTLPLHVLALHEFAVSSC